MFLRLTSQVLVLGFIGVQLFFMMLTLWIVIYPVWTCGPVWCGRTWSLMIWSSRRLLVLPWHQPSPDSALFSPSQPLFRGRFIPCRGLTFHNGLSSSSSSCSSLGFCCLSRSLTRSSLGPFSWRVPGSWWFHLGEQLWSSLRLLPPESPIFVKYKYNYFYWF